MENKKVRDSCDGTCISISVTMNHKWGFVTGISLTPKKEKKKNLPRTGGGGGGSGRASSANYSPKNAGNTPLESLLPPEFSWQWTVVK